VIGASPERLGPGPFGSFPRAPYTSEHLFQKVLVLFSHLSAVTTRLDEVDVATGVERLRRIASDEHRDPASLALHGRVYLGDGWQRQVEQTLELGFDDFSIGYNRQTNPGRPHDQHLEAILAAKPEIDRIVGTGACGAP
jgi:hypothetical protein